MKLVVGTMRGQRARIAAATDREIDLTLERNAYSLLVGCHFALRINHDEFRPRNSFKLGQIGVTFRGKKIKSLLQLSIRRFYWLVRESCQS